MSETYSKLFSSITESTVWSEVYATRILWVTLLAMKDAQGNVYASVPGLARVANITRQECEDGLASFRAPDPDSRTTAHEGRRIVDIDGGWHLLNHGKYSAIRDERERYDYKRTWDLLNRPPKSPRKGAHCRFPDNPDNPDTNRQSPGQSDSADPTNTNTNTKKTTDDGAALSANDAEELLRECGIAGVASRRVRIVGLLEHGATSADFREAARIGIDQGNNTAAYVLGILKKRLQKAPKTSLGGSGAHRFFVREERKVDRATADKAALESKQELTARFGLTRLKAVQPEES